MAQTPLIGKDSFKLPTSFGSKVMPYTLTKLKLKLGALIIIGILLLGLLLMILSIVFQKPYLIMLIIPIEVIAIGVIRKFYFHEDYFLEFYKTLKERDYIYDSTALWGCYDTDIVNNTTVYRLGKYNMVLYQFYRDVTVGKGADGITQHLDAIAEAERVISKKNMQFTHLDVMSSVGNDPRFEIVRDMNLSTIQDKNLYGLLDHEYDYLLTTMRRSQTSYDYYAFYYDCDDDVFFDDLREVIGALMQANYNSYDNVTVYEVPTLVNFIAPYTDFNVGFAKGAVSNSTGSLRHIKVLKTYDAEDNILTEPNHYEALEKQRLKADTKKKIFRKK